LPFGREGGLLPLPPPEGLPVVLGAFAGRGFEYNVSIEIKLNC